MARRTLLVLLAALPLGACIPSDQEIADLCAQKRAKGEATTDQCVKDETGYRNRVAARMILNRQIP